MEEKMKREKFCAFCKTSENKHKLFRDQDNRGYICGECLIECNTKGGANIKVFHYGIPEVIEEHEGKGVDNFCHFCHEKKSNKNKITKMFYSPLDRFDYCDQCVQENTDELEDIETDDEREYERASGERCYFCSRAIPEVKKMITNPNRDGSICDVCVEFCQSIILDDNRNNNI